MQVARPPLFFYFGLLVYKVTSPFCDFAEYTHVFLFFVVFAVMMVVFKYLFCSPGRCIMFLMCNSRSFFLKVENLSLFIFFFFVKMWQ